MATRYKVTTDGETPCLSGHGIIEIEPIDGVTAIVTVEGNGVMFEQHASTCAAILEWEELEQTECSRCDAAWEAIVDDEKLCYPCADKARGHRETESYYGTDADTYYLDSRGQAWLIQSVDGLSKPEKAAVIPTDAVSLSDAVLDDQHREDAAAIEARQIVTAEFAAWLAGTSFAGRVEPGDQWDTVEAWPTPEKMEAARECFTAFAAGDIDSALTEMQVAQEDFV